MHEGQGGTPHKVNVSSAPTVSFELQLRLQRPYNGRRLVPNGFPNCGQPIYKCSLH